VRRVDPRRGRDPMRPAPSRGRWPDGLRPRCVRSRSMDNLGDDTAPRASLAPAAVPRKRSAASRATRSARTTQKSPGSFSSTSETGLPGTTPTRSTPSTSTTSSATTSGPVVGPREKLRVPFGRLGVVQLDAQPGDPRTTGLDESGEDRAHGSTRECNCEIGHQRRACRAPRTRRLHPEPLKGIASARRNSGGWLRRMTFESERCVRCSTSGVLLRQVAAMWMRCLS